jgi:SNF2 family DNA or RNA helicase
MRINLKCPTCHAQLLTIEEKIIGNMLMSNLQCGHKLIRFLSDAEKRNRQRSTEGAEPNIKSTEHANNNANGHENGTVDGTAPIKSINPTQIEVDDTINEIEAIERFAEADSLLESLVFGDDTPENWRNAFPYQREGVEFAEGANLRMLLGDEPGLGKTVQFILMLDRNWEKMTPCLIVCPPSITTHWERFLIKWLQKGKLHEKSTRSIFIHKGRNVPLPEDFDITIVGNNLISGVFAKDSIIENKYSSLCLDECHHFKNEKSERTKSVIEFAGNIPHVIAMSGTPIMNRVDEYFPVLHMIKPEHWPTRQVLNNICEKNSRGQALAIRQSFRPWFFDRTKSYVLRRKKKDHLLGLPKFTRIAEFLNPESLNPVAAKRFAQAYNMLSDQLEEELKRDGPQNILGVMSRLRKLTGDAKAQAAVEYALDILDSDEDGKEKLIIGVHHNSTMTIVEHFLRRAAAERNDPTLIPLKMEAGDGAYKDQVKKQFEVRPNRVLICSILACAEGLDGLQLICSRMLNLEREWNASKEEQFEQRIDRLGQTVPVQAIYFMMLRTIDEWLHELVELKRAVVGSTFDANFESDGNLMRDLALKVTQNRMRILGS